MRLKLFILFAISSQITYSQQQIPFDSTNWDLGENSFIETYGGYECLNANNATTLKDFIFKNGIIEYDVLIQPGVGFPGLRFRDDEKGNFELFYIRTHQSGNPDAMQYTPVPNQMSGWQLYHGDGYSAAKQYHYDEWFHVKIVVSGDRGEAYIENMEKPILVIHELKLGEREGKIGFGGPARYANLSVTPMDNPPLNGNFKTFEKAGSEVFDQYEISGTVSFEDLKVSLKLPKDDELNFSTLQTEHDGLANISMITPFSREKNAVLARVTLKASGAMLKRMDFGFSDHVIVFVNSKPVFYGTDNFRSRDYRYLGTIGYFDSIFLDLKKGTNVITFVVGENFGGWGLKAKLEDLEGVEIIN